MLAACLGQPNLVGELSKYTGGGTVTGYIGRTDYSPVGEGKLPAPSSTGGDYSPTVQGKGIPSIKIVAKNGKCSVSP
jgi:hypothetical protein